MINAKGAFSSETATPVALLAALNKEFGDEWLRWDPIVIWDEISDTFNIEVTQEHRDAVMAIRLCILTNVPWQDWHPFLACALALNGISPDPDVASPCSPTELAYAVSIMRRIKPDEEFDQDVRSMAAIILWDNGICWAPSFPLGDLVNDHLLSLQKEPEQRLLLSFLAKDYLADDGLDAMDDYDTVRLHTLKLKAMDIYVGMKNI